MFQLVFCWITSPITLKEFSTRVPWKIDGRERASFLNFGYFFSREYHHLPAQLSVEDNSKSTIIWRVSCWYFSSSSFDITLVSVGRFSNAFNVEVDFVVRRQGSSTVTILRNYFLLFNGSLPARYFAQTE